jgi:plasmid stabilization system protein ParE
MPAYRISEAAKADLIAIADFGIATFGARQALEYQASPEPTFELLADFPRLGLPT